MPTTISALLRSSKLFVLLYFLLLVFCKSLYSESSSKRIYYTASYKENNKSKDSLKFKQLLFTSLEHSQNTDNTACITEVNVGVGIDMFMRRTGLTNRDSITKLSGGFRFPLLGLSYKQYADTRKKGVLNYNIILAKFQVLGTQLSGMSGLMRKVDIVLVEKKSPIYASTDIDWVSINIGLGYDPFYSSESTRIAIIPSLGLGFRNLSLDTNIFTVLPEDKKEKMHYSFVNASARFLASYKSLNLYTDISIHPFNSLVLLNYKAGISFNLWRTIKEFDVSDCNIFLNFESSNFSTQGSDKEKYVKTIQFIRGGISLRLAGIFDI